MTREDLDRIYGNVRGEIIKRSGIQAVKSVFIGHEKLDEMIAFIGDAYALPAEDRAKLRPSSPLDVLANSDRVRALLSAGAGAKRIEDVRNLFFIAQKHERVAKTAQVLARHGMEVATKFAKTGKVGKAAASGASNGAKGIPLVAAAQVAYTVGTTGWFAWSAVRYNDACYGEMLSKHFPEELSASA